MEQTELFSCVTAVADQVWTAVRTWDPFSRDTTGKQLVRALDSIGANLVEGDGRYSDAEALHFFEIARGSAREAKYWIDTARRRSLLQADQAQNLIINLDKGMQMLNGIINYRRRTKNVNLVREELVAYGSTRGEENA